MKRFAAATAAAALVGLCASGAQAAVVLGATSLHITNASNPSPQDFNLDWIQIAEVLAFQDVTGTDVALASQGATATAPNQYSPEAGPDKAIDGIFPSAYPDIYHSGSPDPAVSFLDVTFLHAVDLSRLAIYGRLDGCCTARDIYKIDILGANNTVLKSVTLDARNESHFAQTSFVPEPAAWALMLTGFGAAGVMLRRRRAGLLAAA